VKQKEVLLVPDGGIAAVVRAVTRYGAQDVETGGFFLASERQWTTVSHVALAGERGVLRKRNLFVVSGPAISMLFDWATVRGCAVVAQFHSHRKGSFLSETDLEHGFAVTDFVSTVVPTYFSPPQDQAAWGWWRYNGHAWELTEAAHRFPGMPTLLLFDEDGVRDA